MTAPPVLVVEMGGTTLRAARFDAVTATLGPVSTCPTPSVRAATDLLSEVHDHLTNVLAVAANLGGHVLDGDRPSAVGVGYPGPIDADGRVLASPTIVRHGEANPFDLVRACSAIWPDVQLLCVNDLTAAGLAHVSDGLRDFAILTVGSGVGHKVFLDGRPRVGSGRGGEIGHLRVDLSPDALRCDCGGTGHLGGLASGRGTVATVRRRAERDTAGYRTSVLGAQYPSGLDSLDGKDVVAAFVGGDEFVRSAVATSQEHLGQGLAAIHLDVGVEDFILTGGFAHAMGVEYVSGVAAAAARCSWAVGQDWSAMVRLDPYGENVALVGLGRALTS